MRARTSSALQGQARRPRGAHGARRRCATRRATCVEREGAVRPDDQGVRRTRSSTSTIRSRCTSSRVAARYTSQFQLANDAYPRGAEARAAADRRRRRVGRPVPRSKYAAQLAEQTLEEVFKVNPNHPDAHAAMAEVIVETTLRPRGRAPSPRRGARASTRRTRARCKVARVDRDRSEPVGRREQDARRGARGQQGGRRGDRDEGHDRVAARRPQGLRGRAPAGVRDQPGVRRALPHRRALGRARAPLRRGDRAREGGGQAQARLLRGDGRRRASATCGSAWRRRASSGSTSRGPATSTTCARSTRATCSSRPIPKEYSFGDDEELPDPLPQRREAGARALPRADDGAGVRRHGASATASRRRRRSRSSSTPTATTTAIRTVGLPDIGALGVCFGQVITAMSPATGDINWGMVLWHELGHVFAIQLSNSRVPRWFTEGLSEYETLIARPEWRRENDADLYGAVAQRDAAVDRRPQLRVHAARRRTRSSSRTTCRRSRSSTSCRPTGSRRSSRRSSCSARARRRPRCCRRSPARRSRSSTPSSASTSTSGSRRTRARSSCRRAASTT